MCGSLAYIARSLIMYVIYYAKIYAMRNCLLGVAIYEGIFA
jgi:hypothetical protein